MSLVTLVGEEPVRERLAWCLPDAADRKAGFSVRVARAPDSLPQRESLLGTAVDYAIRFELARHNNHAVQRPTWVADRASKLGPRYAALLDEAHHHVRAHEQSRAPWRARTVARMALMLAALDPYHRSGGTYVPPPPEDVLPRDLEEVCRLIRILPVERLSHPGLMWLNPSFGRFSQVVGGADADVIAGTELIDIKLSPSGGVVDPKAIRQLLGYAMVASWAREEDPKAPEVRTLAVYYARHGELWRLSPGLLKSSHFRETSTWLKKYVESRSAAES